ncbi:MAG: glucose PTS transporter subunit EIIB [Micrococcales bacterium]|nr:glucose PTS transporter subunit EIIB [Micrococcales bacterium]
MIQVEQLLTALGGAVNITSLEPCITRLRIQVSDVTAVDDTALRQAGAFGVVCSGRIVQVIVGPAAEEIAATLDGMR